MLTTNFIIPDHIALYDELDPTSAPNEIREMASKHLAEKSLQIDSSVSVLRGLRIGVPQVSLTSRSIGPVLKSSSQGIFPFRNVTLNHTTCSRSPLAVKIPWRHRRTCISSIYILCPKFVLRIG